MTRTSLALAIWVTVFCWTGTQGTVLAQDRNAKRTTSPPAIDVQQCRVTLIDRVTLASTRAGVLALLDVRESDHVTAKQTVAGLDSTVAAANLAIARQKAASTVERRMSKKLAELAEVEYEKALLVNKKVDGGNVFSEIEVRRLKLNLDKTTLACEQAENEARIQALTAGQIEAELKNYSIEAPIDGIVTKVYRSRGEAVNMGDPLMEVANLDRVRVEGFVGVVEGMRIKPGTMVTVRLDLPDVDLAEEKHELAGKLVFVDVGVEPVSGQIRVWAEIPNPDGILRSGLPARMRILSASIAAK